MRHNDCVKNARVPAQPKAYSPVAEIFSSGHLLLLLLLLLILLMLLFVLFP